MSVAWLRILLIVLVALHGLGHVFFLVPTLGVADWGFTGRSWLLSGRVAEVAIKVLGGVLWLLVIAGFVAAAIGLWSQQEWWRAVAVASSALSLLGLVLFAHGSQPFLSAAAFDIAALVALVVLRWPSPSLVGA